MARYNKGRKEETHERIVHLASERLRKDGIDGVGVATLMADAGLTHGGFYAHFASKEALVQEAVVYAFDAFQKEPNRHEDARADLGAFIDWYLSAKHRDEPARGCPMAALGPDLARRSLSSRTLFAMAAKSALDRIMSALPPDHLDGPPAVRARTIMSHMLGALLLARLMPSKELADDVLVTARCTARRLAGLDEEAKPIAMRSPAKKPS